MNHDGLAEQLRLWREVRQPEALGELLKAWRDRAYAVALRVTSDSTDAEDAVQDAYLKLMSRTHGFEDLDAFQCSLYRAVVQCSLDVIRKGRRRSKVETVDSSIDRNIPEHAAPVSAEQAETRNLLRGAVEKLNADERVPVTLCFYEGLTVAQAARTLELPRETIRARLNRALERLKTRLRKHGRDASTATIVGILWNDNSVAAPESLKFALDAAFPGRPCAEIPTVQPTPVDATLLQGALPVAAKTVVAAGIAIMVGCGMLLLANRTPGSKLLERAAESKTEAVLQQPERTPAIVPDEKPEPIKEEVEMKSNVAKIVLAGAAVLPFTVNAGEPKADVAAILKQIESRKTEKAAAAAKYPGTTNYNSNPGGTYIQGNGVRVKDANINRGQSENRANPKGE